MREIAALEACGRRVRVSDACCEAGGRVCGFWGALVCGGTACGGGAAFTWRAYSVGGVRGLGRCGTEWGRTARLETRTKESSVRASVWVASLGAYGSRGAGGVSCTAGRWRHGSLLRSSTAAGTRKVVNYAWAGRSQRKLWWRPLVVLTCKSITGPGYRGERLIELPSSWFPLKFPSG